MDNLIKAIYSKNIDTYDNLNLYANNVVITEEAISSVSRGNVESILETTYNDDGALIGFKPYLEYSIFVFTKRVCIYKANVLMVDISPSITIKDFVVYYNYLLCFSYDGSFLWVNLSTFEYGENEILKQDTTFLGTAYIESVCYYLGFIVFSLSNGYLKWTKAMINDVPDDWEYWASGEEDDNISMPQNYYYIGEPVKLGAYSYIIGIKDNAYTINFTSVGDYVSLVADKIDAVPTADMYITFTDSFICLSDKKSMKFYKPELSTTTYTRFKSQYLAFNNLYVDIPCLRTNNLSLKVKSKRREKEYYITITDKSNLFIDGYVFNNKEDIYKVTIGSDGVSIEYFVFGLSFVTMGDIIDAYPTMGDLSLVDYLYMLLYNEDISTLESEVSFVWRGNQMVFDFRDFPLEMKVSKLSMSYDSAYQEDCTVNARRYPYAIFRYRGERELFVMKARGDYLLAGLVVG